MTSLSESQTLYPSNLSESQAKEVLSYLRPTLAEAKKTAQLVTLLKDHVMNLRPSGFREMQHLRKPSKKPLPLPTTDRKFVGKFRFEPPTDVALIGSFATESCFRREICVDIALQIPGPCLGSKDHLNQLYFTKRAYYLLLLAPKIGSDLKMAFKQISFEFLNNNRMKPVLVLRSKKLKNVKLRIMPHPPEGYFIKKRFGPHVNNVKPQWFFGKTVEEINAGDVSTPFYNSSFLFDLNLRLNHKYMSEAIESEPQIKDALLMLKLWLKQRGLKRVLSFPLSMFMVHLVLKKKISKHSSSYQMLRNTLLHLAQSKWDVEGISLSEEEPIPLAQFHKAFGVVLVDSTGLLNICFDVTLDIYERLKHEAEITLKSFDNKVRNSFEAAFMVPVEFNKKFDAIIAIDAGCLLESVKTMGAEKRLLDYSDDATSALITPLINIMKKALGDRVVLMSHEPLANLDIEWSSSSEPPAVKVLKLGILFDPDHVHDVVIKGPPADSSKAAEFREFWGKLSECRKFSDNTICEAVYYKRDTMGLKRNTFAYIVNYVLEKHCNVLPTHVCVHGKQADAILELKGSVIGENNHISVYGTGEEGIQAVNGSYDRLVKTLRGLKDLPLPVSGCRPIAASLRGTEVFPPLGSRTFGQKVPNFKFDEHCWRFYSTHSVTPQTPYKQPIDFSISLETSGKWPHDLLALKMVKVSFYLKLMESLKKYHALPARLLYPMDSLEILFEGYLFRVTIRPQIELPLLRKKEAELGRKCGADRLEKDLELMPKLCSALNGLNRNHLSYGIVCRLAKRWVSSHLLLLQMSEIVIDLLVANLYISPSPYTVPNSPLSGFLRFLSLVADTHWPTTPLIININNEMTKERVGDIENEFVDKRETLPPLFVATPYDGRTLSVFTRDSPCPLILSRLVACAKVAKTEFKQQLDSLVVPDFKMLFRPSFEIYDVVIYLNKDRVINRHQEVDENKDIGKVVPPEHYSLHRRHEMQAQELDFNPGKMYVELLRNVYEEKAYFFYDVYGGAEVAVLWKPGSFDPKPLTSENLKAATVGESVAKDGMANVLPDIVGIMEDFKRLGGDLVDRVQVQSENWASMCQRTEEAVVAVNEKRKEKKRKRKEEKEIERQQNKPKKKQKVLENEVKPEAKGQTKKRKFKANGTKGKKNKPKKNKNKRNFQNKGQLVSPPVK